MRIQKNGRRVVAETEVDVEATDLMFEAEDVAELVAEITGEDVEVTADETTVEFAVGDDVYVVEAEGDEEIVEMSSRVLRGSKKPVSASTRRTVSAGRTVRRTRK